MPIADDEQHGFTLIELLVVVIIIGILAAIAIPVFLDQRERAYLRAAESDVRNAAVLQESYFAEIGAYLDLAPTTGPTVLTLASGDTMVISEGVTIAMVADYNGAGGVCITADHANVGGSPDVTYLNDQGGIQADGSVGC